MSLNTGKDGSWYSSARQGLALTRCLQSLHSPFLNHLRMEMLIYVSVKEEPSSVTKRHVHEGSGRAATIIPRTWVVFIEENLLPTLFDRVSDVENPFTTARLGDVMFDRAVCFYLSSMTRPKLQLCSLSSIHNRMRNGRARNSCLMPSFHSEINSREIAQLGIHGE